LPAFTATAWFHKKLPAELQGDLQKTLREAERWAANEYALALAKGDALTQEERTEVISRLMRYTGLDRRVLEDANLRVSQGLFCRELLRSEHMVVGRIDSRYKGLVGRTVQGAARFDPSLAAVTPPYTAMINHYLRESLEYESDRMYHVLGTGVGAWDFGPSERGYPDTTEDLRAALAKNPNMRLFVASGYYDLATPYTATRYTIDHLGLEPSQRHKIRLEDYDAGHMMYVHEESLAKLKRDVASFIDGAGS
jgi:carboxypeptidase C (cathepsin A)